MAEFVQVATVAELPPGSKKVVEVDGALIVIVNVDGEFFAVEDRCTHDGGPLGNGELDGHELICPRHGARFDVRTGDALTLPAFQAVPVYAVQVDGERILVDID